MGVPVIVNSVPVSFVHVIHVKGDIKGEGEVVGVLFGVFVRCFLLIFFSIYIVFLSSVIVYNGCLLEHSRKKKSFILKRFILKGARCNFY